MKFSQLKGVRYFILYGVIVVGFFTYSSAIGWKWFNPTTVEHERPQGTTGARGHYFRYHK